MRGKQGRFIGLALISAVIIAIVILTYGWTATSPFTWYVLAEMKYPTKVSEKFVEGKGGIKAVYILKPNANVFADPESWKEDEMFGKICDISYAPMVPYEVGFIIAIEAVAYKPYIAEPLPEYIKVEFGSDTLNPKIPSQIKTKDEFTWYSATEDMIRVVCVWGSADEPLTLPVAQFFSMEARVWVYGRP